MGILMLLAFVIADEPVCKSARFDYNKKAAVFVDRDEVLVIYSTEFFEEKGLDNISKRGITYKYRHYVNSTKKEQKGESVVYEYIRTIKKDPKKGIWVTEDVGSIRKIKIGAFHLEWSDRDNASGWLYYPEKGPALHFVNRDEFDNLVLKRFLN